MKPVVLCLSASGRETAGKVAEAIGGSVHGLAGRVVAADVEFADTMDHIRSLFAAGTPIIGICAAGILIRAVAPLLSDKWVEPPVVAVSDDGASIVPLLGGHHGANRLAREVADALSGHAALTTAGDVAFGIALDEPPPGWRLANPQDAKAFAAALLAGQGVRIEGEQQAQWLSALRRDEKSLLRVVVTEQAYEPGPSTLVYHPQTLAVGIGSARGCDLEELCDLVRETLTSAELAANAVAGVFSLDLKADEPAMTAVADMLGVPFRVFDAATLETEAPRLVNPSDVVFAEVGCHGVAEGAALAAVGPEGALVVEKHKSANATCAVARTLEPLAQLPGRKRGQVALVGIGPGKADWRTPEASRLVANAEELIGYGLYIDLLGAVATGKPRQDFPLGGEEERCRYALERAGEGRDVAIICSGDAGIYAMGALVFELLDRSPDAGGVSDAARRVAVVTAPGVSALQAAAARAGAPLGHDFCAISLSDLLTPRETIIQRIAAAAEGDFVIAFYNPVSKRRRTLLAEARDMLLAHRPADTPVLLATNLGRPEENLVYRRLSELEVDEVDMLTVVLVGASQSRIAELGGGPRFYTPRGYAKRIDSPDKKEA